MELFVLILFLAAIIWLVLFRLNFARTKGQRGERRIGKILSSLPADEYIVLNDLIYSYNGRTTQIDHIVVSIYGIFVIETKNYTGWIFGNTDKDYWTQNIWGNKFSLYNPVKQNKNHIKFLYSKFDVIRENINSVYPIVAFLGVSRLEVTGEKECVIRGDEVINYISGFSARILRKEDCDYIAVKLEMENIGDKEGRTAHTINVRKAVTDYEDKLRKDICPRCGGRLVLRNGKYGNFYGCSNYPTCRYTI